MRQSIQSFLLVVLYVGSAMAEPLQIGYPESYLDDMAIQIAPGSDRPYVYSGYGDSFYYSTMADEVSDGHMGYIWSEFKLWHDFEVVVNGAKLRRSEADIAFKPHEIVFTWPHGITLKILPLFRDKNYLRFKLDGLNDKDAATFNLIFHNPERNREADENLQIVYSIQADSDTLWFGIAEKQPRGVGVTGFEMEDDFRLSKMGYGNFDVVFLYANSKNELVREWQRIASDLDAGTLDRKEWLLDEINRAYFHCENERINKALNWAKISLAQLWAENETALWAGLPWFNDCWGRDTFISLAGACLVQGKFEQAKALLKRFARWQCKDPDDPNYGRIPNRARFGDIGYNTADGTPWFVKGVYDYGLYSGDMELWKEFMGEDGAVRLANEGTLKYHTDSLGFLVHGEAETWMDAVGPDGPWSPRGNRAVEVQALWMAQLNTSFYMAEKLASEYPDEFTEFKEHPSLQAGWVNTHGLLRKHFQEHFSRRDGSGFYDHLNEDGTADQKIRPNQLFTFVSHSGCFFNWPKRWETKKEDVIDIVSKHTAYQYGIASLSQGDSEFHPYHQYPLYPKDEAYHNGVVWTWLSGPYKSATKGGWLIAKSEIDQILNIGAPGTLSELLDAVPREGENFPRPSGTVSQTWSLAEFIRTWYQDYVGISSGGFPVHPRVPKEWGDFEVILNKRNERILFKATIEDDSVKFTYIPIKRVEKPIKLWQYLVSIDGKSTFRAKAILTGHESAEISFKREGDWIINAPPNEAELKIQFFQPDESSSDYLQPAIAPNLKALQTPDHRLLTGPEIKAVNQNAALIVDLTDPEGDDVGDGGYVYPTEANFQPGIFDLIGFRLTFDDTYVYFSLQFRNLVQPGWHPEYGFQLTFASIAIQTGLSENVRRNVGRNSRWMLQGEYAADRFIHIGGGILLEDGGGKILCEYKPSDPKYAFGDVQRKQISFALPKEFLPGNPKDWKFTVLTGAQDDHGGAGLGEFREVAAQAERWKGGGGGPGKPNVYDTLIFPGE